MIALALMGAACGSGGRGGTEQTRTVPAAPRVSDARRYTRAQLDAEGIRYLRIDCVSHAGEVDCVGRGSMRAALEDKGIVVGKDDLGSSDAFCTYYGPGDPDPTHISVCNFFDRNFGWDR